MVVELVVTGAATFVVTAPTCTYLGVRLRGKIPLRMPSNSLRVANAETDVKLAELARKRRQEELNLEHDDLLGVAKIAETRRRIESGEEERKQLTTGKEDALLTVRLRDALRDSYGTWVSETDPDALILILREQAQLGRERLLQADVLAKVVVRLIRTGQAPAYVRDAYNAYSDDIPF